MRKMNWDRVRWERRAARQGSEWADSKNGTPQSAPYARAPFDTRSSSSAFGISKKRKKKTKRNVAQSNARAQTKSKPTDNSQPNVMARKLSQAPLQAAGSRQNPPIAVTSQVNRTDKAPVFVQKVTTNGL